MFQKIRRSTYTLRGPPSFSFSSNAGIPFVAAIFPKSAAAAANAGDPIDRLDAHHIFCHLVAELPLDAESQRCAMRNGKRRAIHLISKDRLGMEGVLKSD